MGYIFGWQMLIMRHSNSCGISMAMHGELRGAAFLGNSVGSSVGVGLGVSGEGTVMGASGVGNVLGSFVEGTVHVCH
jgi:hypothetical protein